MSRQSDACPNPKGMTVEFAQEIIETRSWRIKGVGQYGSDVNVVALDEYQELVHAYKGALDQLTAWAEIAQRRQRVLLRVWELASALNDRTPEIDGLWREIREETGL